MSLIDTIVATFAPHSCLGCGAEGHLLCTACLPALHPVPSRCYRCKKLTENSRTCLTCRRLSKLHTVQAATIYDGLAKDIVWQLKFQGAQAAASEMAALMVPLLPDKTVLLTHVPTATSRIRQRGYDQARLLALALAQKTDAGYLPLLTRMGQHHQVGANRSQRITQLAAAFRPTNRAAIQGAHIVLVDDVLTTGATLEAAAKTLKAAGAARVEALVFAQA